MIIDSGDDWSFYKAKNSIQTIVGILEQIGEVQEM